MHTMNVRPAVDMAACHVVDLGPKDREANAPPTFVVFGASVTTGNGEFKLLIHDNRPDVVQAVVNLSARANQKGKGARVAREDLVEAMKAEAKCVVRVKETHSGNHIPYVNLFPMKSGEQVEGRLTIRLLCNDVIGSSSEVTEQQRIARDASRWCWCGRSVDYKGQRCVALVALTTSDQPLFIQEIMNQGELPVASDLVRIGSEEVVNPSGRDQREVKGGPRDRRQQEVQEDKRRHDRRTAKAGVAA